MLQMTNNVNFFGITKTNVGTNSAFTEIINDIVKYVFLLFLYLSISFISIPYNLFTVLKNKNV